MVAIIPPFELNFFFSKDIFYINRGTNCAVLTQSQWSYKVMVNLALSWARFFREACASREFL